MYIYKTKILLAVHDLNPDFSLKFCILSLFSLYVYQTSIITLKRENSFLSHIKFKLNYANLKKKMFFFFTVKLICITIHINIVCIYNMKTVPYDIAHCV